MTKSAKNQKSLINVKKLRNVIFIIVSVIIFSCAYTQKNSQPTEFDLRFGQGIVDVEIEKLSNNQLDFYSDYEGQSLAKTIKFIIENEPGRGFQITDFADKGNYSQWLKPHLLIYASESPDANPKLQFRFLEQAKNGAVKVFINNETSQSLWLKPGRAIKIRNWKEHLSNCRTLHALKEKNFLYAKPKDTNSELNLVEYPECFKMLEMQDDWIKVSTDHEPCMTSVMHPEKIIAWLQWRDDKELLVYCAYLC